jgi:cytochrome c oxidase subunit 1
VGAIIVLISGLLFLFILARGQRTPATDAGAYRFSIPLHMPAQIPVALNGFGLWLALMIGLTVVNYGFPIAHLMALKNTSVPAVYSGEPR